MAKFIKSKAKLDTPDALIEFAYRLIDEVSVCSEDLSVEWDRKADHFLKKVKQGYGDSLDLGDFFVDGKW